MKVPKIQVFALLVICILVGCEKRSGPTYRPYSELFDKQSDTTLARILTRWKELKIPQPVVMLSIDSPWYFTPGDSTEGFQYGSVVVGKEPVKLPHRILRPNTPLWYESRIKLPSPGVLRIRGDDGAQLFIDGKRVARIHNDFFPVTDVTAVTLTVRVLNNAMQGGLRSVQFLTNEEYQRYVERLSQYRELHHLVEQTVLLNDRPDQLVDRTMLALSNMDDFKIRKVKEVISETPYIVGPWIQREEDKSFIVRVLTDEEQTITLRYGKSPALLTESQVQTNEIFKFRLVPQDTSRIYYQLTCRQTISPIYEIATAESKAFSFNAWADSQSGWETFQANLNNLSGSRDAFGVGAGDLVGDGSNLEEWRSFYNVLSSHSPSVPFYLIAGNHDYDGFYDKLDPVYYRTFNKYDEHSYYSWSYGNCSFIMLDPNETFPIDISEGSMQYDWFMKELQSPAWKKATWRFIVLHQPPYSQGWPGYSGDHFLRRLFDPIVDTGGIDFVIAGHTHDYERFAMKKGDGETTYLILGGGGGSLEPPESSTTLVMDTVVKRHHIGRFFVDGGRIRFEARATDGKLIDTLTRYKQVDIRSK